MAMASATNRAISSATGSCHAPRHQTPAPGIPAATWRPFSPPPAQLPRVPCKFSNVARWRPRTLRRGRVSGAAGGEAPTKAAAPATSAPPTQEKEKSLAPAPSKPTLAKGTIVRVDKEKYLASVEYRASGHPPYFKGLDYIYEARGEVLDARIFEHGEYALISWAGIPTAPAWLSAAMLIKCDKLEYVRT